MNCINYSPVHCNIKGPSNALSNTRCCGSWPLLTALQVRLLFSFEILQTTYRFVLYCCFLVEVYCQIMLYMWHSQNHLTDRLFFQAFWKKIQNQNCSNIGLYVIPCAGTQGFHRCSQQEGNAISSVYSPTLWSES